MKGGIQLNKKIIKTDDKREASNYKAMVLSDPALTTFSKSERTLSCNNNFTQTLLRP
jgi:hypothetical protein